MRARDARGRFIRPLQSRVKDLSGQTFNGLEVIRFCGRRKIKNGTRAKWLCKCLRCGKRTAVATNNLTSSNTKSCGCLRDTAARKTCGSRITHGHTIRDERGYVSSEYTAYCSARQRCNDPKVRRWLNYGGANPPVKFLWTSFQQFLDEVGCKPVIAGVRYSLGRKDDTGNYGPGLGNRWQTDAEQIAARYAKHNGCYTAQQQANLGRAYA
jgi:hypothetical protein